MGSSKIPGEKGVFEDPTQEPQTERYPDG